MVVLRRIGGDANPNIACLVPDLNDLCLVDDTDPKNLCPCDYTSRSLQDPIVLDRMMCLCLITPTTVTSIIYLIIVTSSRKKKKYTICMIAIDDRPKARSKSK